MLDQLFMEASRRSALKMKEIPMDMARKSDSNFPYPIKNYVLGDKFGSQRSVIPYFKDPNPLKYGGKYGL